MREIISNFHTRTRNGSHGPMSPSKFDELYLLVVRAIWAEIIFSREFCILGATKRSFFLYELKQFLKIHLIGNNQPLRDYRFCNCLSLMSISISATDHALDLTKRIVFVKTISWTVLKNLIPQIFPWHYFATVFWNLIAFQKTADIQSTTHNDHFNWNLF